MATTKPKQTTTALTLGEFAEQYLKHLEEIGKSRGTVFSYSIDLGVALKHFGEDRPVAGITPDQVAAFFESEAVTKTRTGKPKAKPTIDKCRRVLRLALVWAAEQKLIPTAPLPPKPEKPAKATEPQTSQDDAPSNGSAH